MNERGAAMPIPPLLPVIAVVWLAVIIGAGLAGGFEALSPPLLAGSTGGLVLMLLALIAASPAVRSWLMAIDLRWLVGLHLTRLTGLALLVLSRRGQLPEEYALHAGWGDVAVALTAAGVIGLLSLPQTRRPRSILAWNVFGLIQFGVAIHRWLVTAAADPDAMISLHRLPLALLPAFLYPVLIASHLVIFVRWNHQPSRSA